MMRRWGSGLVIVLALVGGIGGAGASPRDVAPEEDNPPGCATEQLGREAPLRARNLGPGDAAHLGGVHQVLVGGDDAQRDAVPTGLLAREGARVVEVAVVGATAG